MPITKCETGPSQAQRKASFKSVVKAAGKIERIERVPLTPEELRLYLSGEPRNETDHKDSDT